MTTQSMPEDFPGGVAEMIGKGTSEGYDPLRPLAKRTPTEIKLKSGEGDDEATLALKYGYSAPINQHSRLTQKIYGYVRDGNLEGPLEQSSVRGAHSLNDLIFDAPCVNRDARYQEEERRIKELMPYLDRSPTDVGVIDDEEKPKKPKIDIDALLDRWSDADAFMRQALIVEEQRGIEAAEHMYKEYKEKSARRDEVLMEASKLPPAYNAVFWCSVRKYEIIRERAYDLAMGYPTHDFTEVKREVAEGHDIHEFVHRMAWPFREGYHLVMGSGMDGKSHRELLMAMVAGQLPAQMPPWGMAPGFWPQGMPPGQPGAEGEDEDGQQDKRGALVKLFGKKAQNPQDNQIQRNGRGSRR